jgi:DnaK suppressor protein
MMRRASERFRRESLRRMLEQRRLDIRNSVHDRMRTVRDEGEASARRADLEGSDTAVQEDLELDLIQIHAEMIEKITDALARVEDGDYGRCRECGEDIAAIRLRALPFATRCKACQEVFELAEKRSRRVARHAAIFSPDLVLSGDDR